MALHGPKGSDTNFASMELRSADSLPCDTDAYLDADVDDDSDDDGDDDAKTDGDVDVDDGNDKYQYFCSYSHKAKNNTFGVLHSRNALKPLGQLLQPSRLTG